MNLSKYTLKDCLLTAIKSEMEAYEIYNKIAKSVKNIMLKDRLEFLAKEEIKHKEFFEKLYRTTFPDEEIKLPKKSPVPLPEIEFNTEMVLLSDILSAAMDAEMAAYEFYTELSKIIKDKSSSNTLKYIASMEMGHYGLIEIERELAREREDYEIEWGMMHVGP